MTITRIVNRPVASNCFVVTDLAAGSTLVVDPGHHQAESILERIVAPVEYILLTHEHFDHVWGVETIRERYPAARLVAMQHCAEAIVSRKGNMSVFYDGVGFELRAAEVVVAGATTMAWGEHLLELIPTAGHTRGSMCIALDNVLFTGDTLIPHIKTVLKLPGGSREALKASFADLKRRYGGNKAMMIYPGHGNPLEFSRIELEDIM